MPEKTARGPFEIFQHPFCRKTSKNQKIEGGPFGGFFSEKKTMSKKTEKGDL